MNYHLEMSWMTNTKKAQIQHNEIHPKLRELFESNTKKEILCVYKILCKENKIPSKRLVEIALSQEENNECFGCASADNIFRAVKKLQEMGFVVSHLCKEGYLWELLEEFKND